MTMKTLRLVSVRPGAGPRNGRDWGGFDGEMSSHAEHVVTSRIVGPKAPVGKLPFCH